MIRTIRDEENWLAQVFEERGKKFGRTPRLVIRSDFSAEKNGIRHQLELLPRGGTDARARADGVHRRGF